MSGRAISVIISAAILISVPSAFAEDRLVPSEYSTIQAAIDDCNEGDVVIIAPGTYTGVGNRRLDFGGKAITVRGIDPNDANVVAATIIDCNGSHNSWRNGFYFHSGEDGNSIVEGLTITNGNHPFGGGIYCGSDSSPTISQCIIRDNVAELISGGGGIYMGGSATIRGCIISDNSGDGIFCAVSSSATITECVITGTSGTGIVNNGDCKISYCLITGNSSNTSGGGVQFWNSPSTIRNCVIFNNSATDGGGICSKYGSPTIENCTIIGNSCTNDGGGLDSTSSSNTTVRNCIIYGNSAGGSGQDVSVRSSSELTISYSNVKDGQASVYVDGGTLNWGSGNIGDNPFLVDLISGEYHLAAQSPCINSGDPNYIPTTGETDIDGDSRIINGLIDIGADEFDEGAPVIGISPWELYFSCYKAEGDPAPQILTVRNTGTGTINWEAIEDCIWLTVDPCSGESSGEVNEVTVSIDSSSLSPGVHICQIEVTADEAINNPQVATVTLDISDPIIEYSPLQVEFTTPEGQRYPDDQILSIYNSGIGILEWSIDEEYSWLDVNPTTGESTGETDEVVLSVDIDGLVPGDYNGLLAITGEYAANSPQVLPIYLHVSEPYIVYSPNTFNFAVSPSVPASQQNLSISNGGGGTLSWELTSDCNWLDIIPTDGNTMGETDGVLIGVETSGLEAGDYNCTVTISADGASNSPQSVQVFMHIHSDGNEVLYVPGQFRTIQSAIDAALDGDVVIVEPGIYTGSGNRDLDFGGKAIAVRSTDPNDANIVATTVINCNGSAAEPHWGFYFHNGEDANSVVEGLTITNGYLYTNGAGISCYNASPTISKCRFINGTVENFGSGGIDCYTASPIISDCHFIGNSAMKGGAITTHGSCTAVIKNCLISSNTCSDSGGGINIDTGSSPIIENCIITGNFAGGNGGGGISIYESNPTVRNCFISDNSSDSGGGGILCRYQYYDSRAVIENCTISGNTGDYCGGMEVGNDCNVIITDCNFTGNSAVSVGGICIIGGSTATVADCNFTGNSSNTSGGGVYCGGDSNTTLVNCTIAENNAVDWGGGICAVVCNMTITECTIRDNRLAIWSPESRGGGIYCGTANVTIEGCIIKNNEAESESGLGGGVCGSYGITLTIEDSNVTGNIAGNHGGGIYADNNCVTIITDCTIRDNRTMVSGGGIYGGDGDVTVKRCVINNNTAGGGGGGVFGSYDDEGSLAIENCFISDNNSGWGGGLAECNGPISNCIITNNTVVDGSSGGGLAICQNITNCTIANNTAFWAGGLYHCEGITNCIIWGNYADWDPQLDDSCSEPNYSCIQDWVGGGTGNISADPCFAKPGYWADVNDPNIVVEPNDPNAVWVDGDYHLSPSSPCFNAGDPNYVPEPNEVDIYGEDRVIDGRVDMGADELGHCMAQTNPDYDTWVSLGEPNCWCYEYQCRGDADGYRQLLFWVYSFDLNILKSAYGKPNIDSEPPVCADFDHKEQVTFRVYSNDLAILKSYYGKTNVPSCSNPPDPNFNYWTLP